MEAFRASGISATPEYARQLLGLWMVLLAILAIGIWAVVQGRLSGYVLIGIPVVATPFLAWSTFGCLKDRRTLRTGQDN